MRRDWIVFGDSPNRESESIFAQMLAFVSGPDLWSIVGRHPKDWDESLIKELDLKEVGGRSVGKYLRYSYPKIGAEELIMERIQGATMLFQVPIKVEETFYEYPLDMEDHDYDPAEEEKDWIRDRMIDAKNQVDQMAPELKGTEINYQITQAQSYGDARLIEEEIQPGYYSVETLSGITIVEIREKGLKMAVKYYSGYDSESALPFSRCILSNKEFGVELRKFALAKQLVWVLSHDHCYVDGGIVYVKKVPGYRDYETHKNYYKLDAVQCQRYYPKWFYMIGSMWSKYSLKTSRMLMTKLLPLYTFSSRKARVLSPLDLYEVIVPYVLSHPEWVSMFSSSNMKVWTFHEEYYLWKHPDFIAMVKAGLSAIGGKYKEGELTPSKVPPGIKASYWIMIWLQVLKRIREVMFYYRYSIKAPLEILLCTQFLPIEVFGVLMERFNDNYRAYMKRREDVISEKNMIRHGLSRLSGVNLPWQTRTVDMLYTFSYGVYQQQKGEYQLAKIFSLEAGTFIILSQWVSVRYLRMLQSGRQNASNDCHCHDIMEWEQLTFQFAQERTVLRITHIACTKIGPMYLEITLKNYSKMVIILRGDEDFNSENVVRGCTEDDFGHVIEERDFIKKKGMKRSCEGGGAAKKKKRIKL